MSLLSFTFCLLFIIIVLVKIEAKFEFTNLKCIPLDKDYIDVDYCFLKSINRTYKYCSVKIHLKTIPIKSFMVNLALFKRLNGYKPFLYNITFDGCKLLANPKGNPVANYFYEFIKPFSNINHTCPYQHDLIVDKVPIDFVNYRFTNVLPFPQGDYLIETSWIVKGISRGVNKVYGTIS